MSQSNNKQLDRYFVVLGGATMPTGSSLNLAKGQIGVFSMKEADQNGQKAISNFAGRSKKENYVLKMGRGTLSNSRSHSNRGMSSVPFALEDVKSVKVSAPKTTEQKVDDVILGYNGIDPESAIRLIRADRKKITLELSGELIGMYGYPNNTVLTTVYLDPAKYYGTEACTDGDNCEEVNARPYVLEAIEQLRRYQLRGGVELQDVVDITPVEASTGGVTPTTEDRFYQTLTVQDAGDQAAFAAVQAQYPDTPLVRISQVDVTSVYQTLTETDTLLPAFVRSTASLIKGCEDCPANYTEVDGGFIYSVKIEDDGADLTTTVDDLPGFVTGTVEKTGQFGGKGVYTLVLSAELTDAQIATYAAASAVKGTAEITLIGEVVDICTNGATTTTAWVLGETCEVSTQTYSIVLPDNDCGENRLAELQAHYPDNTITLATIASDNSARTVTLTGTSGTANISVAGVNYLATFATNLTTTANNFVTANAAAIFTATGATVTANAGVLTFTDATTGFPAITITNVTTNLAGTLGAVTVVPAAVTGGCQTRYQTDVVTNMVCEECSEIFRDFFTSEAPRPYENTEWVIAPTAEPTTSLMGIRFRGKKLEIRSNEYLRDKIGFTDTSVQIRVTGGQLDEVRYGIGELKDEQMATTYLSHWEPRTHLGGNFQDYEMRDRVYFTGEEPQASALTRVLFTQEESSLDQSKQYVDYSIEVERNKFSTMPSNKHQETIIYHILAAVGEHQAVESLVNAIAGAAGIDAVRAFSA